MKRQLYWRNIKGACKMKTYYFKRECQSFQNMLKRKSRDTYQETTGSNQENNIMNRKSNDTAQVKIQDGNNLILC